MHNNFISSAKSESYSESLIWFNISDQSHINSRVVWIWINILENEFEIMFSSSLTNYLDEWHQIHPIPKRLEILNLQQVNQQFWLVSPCLNKLSSNDTLIDSEQWTCVLLSSNLKKPVFVQIRVLWKLEGVFCDCFVLV